MAAAGSGASVSGEGGGRAPQIRTLAKLKTAFKKEQDEFRASRSKADTRQAAAKLRPEEWLKMQEDKVAQNIKHTVEHMEDLVGSVYKTSELKGTAAAAAAAAGGHKIGSGAATTKAFVVEEEAEVEEEASREYESSSDEGKDLRPRPDGRAPLENYNALRPTKGLAGVLSHGRERVEGLLSQLHTEERIQVVGDLNDFFQKRAPEAIQMDKEMQQRMSLARASSEPDDEQSTAPHQLVEAATHRSCQQIHSFVEHLKREVSRSTGGVGQMLKKLHDARKTYRWEVERGTGKNRVEEMWSKVKDLKEELVLLGSTFADDQGKTSQDVTDAAAKQLLQDLEAEAEDKRNQHIKLTAEVSSAEKRQEALRQWVMELKQGELPETPSDPWVRDIIEEAKERIRYEKKDQISLLCTDVPGLEERAKGDEAAAEELKQTRQPLDVELANVQFEVESVHRQVSLMELCSPHSAEQMPAVAEEAQRLEDTLVDRRQQVEASWQEVKKRQAFQQQLVDACAELRTKVGQAIENLHLEAASEAPQEPTIKKLKPPHEWTLHLASSWGAVEPKADLFARLLDGPPATAGEPEPLAIDVEEFGERCQEMWSYLGAVEDVLRPDGNFAAWGAVHLGTTGGLRGGFGARASNSAISAAGAGPSAVPVARRVLGKALAASACRREQSSAADGGEGGGELHEPRLRDLWEEEHREESRRLDGARAAQEEQALHIRDLAEQLRRTRAARLAEEELRAAEAAAQ